MPIQQIRWHLVLLIFMLVGLPSLGHTNDIDTVDPYYGSPGQPFTPSETFTPSQPFTPDNGWPGQGHGSTHDGWNNHDQRHDQWGHENRHHQKDDGWYHDDDNRHDRRRADHHKHKRPDSWYKHHSSHRRHYKKYFSRLHKNNYYHPHETYHYHTHYLAPIPHHYHRHGYRRHVLPVGYSRFYLHGAPYYYYNGVYYSYYDDRYYEVIRAPIGAAVPMLPIGFITFHIGLSTYYYVNDTYYIWDNVLESYVVVEKPTGAAKAIDEATEGRLRIYPNQTQSEEQQATDRYECHRWAVTETGTDPTLDDENETNVEKQRHYRNAISTCLQGRGYAVK